MDGWCRVAETVRATVRNWAQHAARRLDSATSNSYDSIHLDDLVGSSYLHDQAVRLALECFEELRKAADEIGYPFRVAIALRSTEKLAVSKPPLGRIQDEIHELEPPSIYICRDLLAMYIPYYEEFRTPIVHSIDMGTDSVLCYYTCFRTLSSAARNEEYSRVVWYDSLSQTGLATAEPIKSVLEK
jgi:hypothetical protein